MVLLLQGPLWSIKVRGTVIFGKGVGFLTNTHTYTHIYTHIHIQTQVKTPLVAYRLKGVRTC